MFWPYSYLEDGRWRESGIIFLQLLTWFWRNQLGSTVPALVVWLREQLMGMIIQTSTQAVAHIPRSIPIQPVVWIYTSWLSYIMSRSSEGITKATVCGWLFLLSWQYMYVQKRRIYVDLYDTVYVLGNKSKYCKSKHSELIPINHRHDWGNNTSLYALYVFQQHSWTISTWWAAILVFRHPGLVPWEAVGTSCVGDIRVLLQWVRFPESHDSHMQLQHDLCIYRLTDQQTLRSSNCVKCGFMEVSELGLAIRLNIMANTVTLKIVSCLPYMTWEVDTKGLKG